LSWEDAKHQPPQRESSVSSVFQCWFCEHTWENIKYIVTEMVQKRQSGTDPHFSHIFFKHQLKYNQGLVLIPKLWIVPPRQLPIEAELYECPIPSLELKWYLK
jgi:hypothetical protein